MKERGVGGEVLDPLVAFGDDQDLPRLISYLIASKDILGVETTHAPAAISRLMLWID